jgi:putative DNA helicase II
VYKEYQKSLLYSNAVDFDDLLLFPYLLFKKYPNILEKYQRIFSYLLVDEAQDTNWIQFELLRLLTAKKNNYITFVGDDYQSIY